MNGIGDVLRAGDPGRLVKERPLDARAERELRVLLQNPAGPAVSRTAPSGPWPVQRRLVGLAAAAALALVTTLLLWPQGVSSRPTHRQYAVEALRAGAAGGGGAVVWSPGSVLDAMPSVGHRVGSNVLRGSRLVVRGRFVSWARGTAYGFAAGGSQPEGRVSWNDPHAQRREVVLRLRVDQVIDRAPGTTLAKPGQTLDVTTAVPGDRDAARVAQGLLELGEVVPFLGGGVDGPWQRTVPTHLASPPALLATANTSGELTWPLMGGDGTEEGAQSLRVDAHTVADLQRAARPRMVTVR